MSTMALAAANAAVRAGVPDMADKCQRLLGQRTVAFVTGNRSPKMIGRWALGQNEPQEESRERLRALYRTIRILEEGKEQPTTIQAWLLGSNPGLDDRAPVELLRDKTDVPVFKAAENFISESIDEQ